jgi:hypothetical protein
MPWRHMGEWMSSSTILNLITRWKWVVNFMTLPLYPWGNSPHYPLYRRLGINSQIKSNCMVNQESYNKFLHWIFRWLRENKHKVWDSNPTCHGPGDLGGQHIEEMAFDDLCNGQWASMTKLTPRLPITWAYLCKIIWMVVSNNKGITMPYICYFYYQ